MQDILLSCGIYAGFLHHFYIHVWNTKNHKIEIANSTPYLQACKLISAQRAGVFDELNTRF